MIAAALQVLLPWTNYLPLRMFIADSLHLLFSLILLCGAARFLEREKLTNFGLGFPPGSTGEFWRGAALGAAMVTIVTVLLFALGCYRIISVQSNNDFLALVPALLVAAFLEELIFRGYIFRILEKASTTNLALIISSLMFGAVHMLNFKGDESWTCKLLSCTALGLDAGLLFGCAFLVTRRLWLATGIHVCWNLFEGPFYGTPISGLNLGKPVLLSLSSGPQWLTGGTFGPEASLIEVVICLILAIWLYRLAMKRQAAGLIKELEQSANSV